MNGVDFLSGMVPILRPLIRPGMRSQTISEPRPAMTIGDRGTVSAMIDLPWGPDDRLIQLSAEEFIRGGSERLIGWSAADVEAHEVSLLFYGITNNTHLAAHTAYLMRLNTGGARAEVTAGDLTATARYFGTKGNNLSIVVQEDEPPINLPDDDPLPQTYTVMVLLETPVGHDVVSRQTITDYSELQPRSEAEIAAMEEQDRRFGRPYRAQYVIWGGTGTPQPQMALPLTGGTNGTSSYTAKWPSFRRELDFNRNWNVAAINTLETSVLRNAVSFIRSLREDESRGVVAAIPDGVLRGDYHGIIRVASRPVILGREYSLLDSVLLVAGASAGASVLDSLTAGIIPEADDFYPHMSSREYEQALLSGAFVFRQAWNGGVAVEQDINSFRTFTLLLREEFSKNKVIRVLDMLKDAIRIAWERKYMGKVPNNQEGRDLFHADIHDLMYNAQQVGAIQDYRGMGDIEVRQGDMLDEVVVHLHTKPVDVMEKLYLTNFVRVQVRNQAA